ncbi:hypothetical protein D9M70_544170 [compost metagenome]
MADTGHQVVQQCGQQAPDHQLGQRVGQTRFHLLEAFLGTQGLIECKQQHGDTQEEDDTGNPVQDGRVSSDWEFDRP